MIDVNIHNIERVTAEALSVTHVGLVGVLRLTTSGGASATLFMTPAQAEALAAAWQAASAQPVDDDAAVAAYRKLEEEDAERDDTFAELEEMTAQPKETVDA